jgi:hypothetical protein
MNSVSIFILKALRKIYTKTFAVQPLSKPKCIQNVDIVSKLIYDKLMLNESCMISRFGAVEISALTNYIGIKNKNHNILKFIRGVQPEWWWNEGIRRCMTDNAGFFPNTNENLQRFAELMLEDIKQIDILASWQPNEIYFVHLFPHASFIHYTSIDPFWADEPWTRYLENKKVLVVHPFSEEIEFQYKNSRTKLFCNKKVLPCFELIAYRSVQSIGGSTQFNSWFDALQYMKDEIDKIDYDICLLGCGAYGMPLAAHIKRQGKKAVHFGGSLQLLFGIKGKRWEDPYYGYNIHGELGKYQKLFNEYWIRPFEVSQIKNMEKVDGGSYW